jgi:hypothetical protein
MEKKFDLVFIPKVISFDNFHVGNPLFGGFQVEIRWIKV